MKFFISILLISFLTRTNCQLSGFLLAYPACIDPTVNITDDFFRTNLPKSFDEALEFFKYIYTQGILVCGNQNPICNCLIQLKERLGLSIYEIFFTNPSYFTDLKIILSDVKNNYRILNQTLIYTNGSFPSIELYPSVESFVFKYDFTYTMALYYAETKHALHILNSRGGLNACFQAYLNIDLSLSTSTFSNSQLTEYAKCVAEMVSPLDRPIRRFVLFGIVSRFPQIINGKLIEFIDRLFESAPWTNPRKSVWVVGDPHIFSLNQQYQICNFLGEKPCLETASFSIYCQTSRAINGKPATILRGVKVVYRNGNRVVEFSVSNSSYPGEFTNGTRVVKSGNDSDWLVISSPRANIRSILDYQSKTTVIISRTVINGNSCFGLMVRSRIRSLSGATGILATGCEQVDLEPGQTNSRLGRHKRSTTCSSVGSTSDETMTSSVAQSICSYDVSTTGDSSYAALATDAVESLNQLRIDDSVFPSGSQSLTASLISILIFIVIAVFEIGF